MHENPYKSPEAIEGLPAIKRRLWPKLHWTEWVTMIVILGVLYLLLLPAPKSTHHRWRSVLAAKETKPVDFWSK